jgi:hypothetical protein
VKERKRADALELRSMCNTPAAAAPKIKSRKSQFAAGRYIQVDIGASAELPG